jgi:two-component system nitrogen regulation response regulator GlnG
MQEIFKRIGMVSLSDASVLIQGETGTGKEVAARAIHEASARRDGPFVPVHVAAIPDTLLESELFGFEKGAFTGASAPRPGRLLRADGGTLFLDEVKEIPKGLQVKLLRVLEERTVEGLGAGERKPLDVRVIAASQGDLAKEVEAGRFREDLYFRLNVFPIRMPPLRERRDDIPRLAAHFLEAFRGGDAGIAPETLESLLAHDWPGNVRELRNAVEHAAVLARGRTLEPEHLPQNVRREADASERALPLVREAVRRAAADAEGAVYEAVLDLFEKPLLAEAMRLTGGNQVKAASLLGIHRTTLRKKLEKHGL